jgi:hypothetical protein
MVSLSFREDLFSAAGCIRAESSFLKLSLALLIHEHLRMLAKARLRAIVRAKLQKSELRFRAQLPEGVLQVEIA